MQSWAQIWVPPPEGQSSATATLKGSRRWADAYVSNASALTGVASDVEGFLLPQWLLAWVPPELTQAMTSLLADFAPVVESLLQTMPALAGGLTVVAWVIWGLGSALLLRKRPANPSCRFAQTLTAGCQRCGSSSPILL